MKKSTNESGMVEVIIVFVIALLVGAAGGYTIGHKKTTTTASTGSAMAAPSSATKAADLRADLVTLGIEHMTLTNQAVDAALDGAKNAAATGAALYANGTDIGAAVGSVYGKDAETTFNTVWKLHLDEFVKYAVADSKGDAAGKKAALDAIDSGYTIPLAKYLANANPNLPEAALETGLRDHVDMTAKMIDLHVAGDYTGEASELSMANKHLEGIFSTLAGGIVKQYPDKF